MTLPITMILGSSLALWFVILSLRVIGERRAGSDSEEKKTRIERRVRGHANFAEYAPLGIVLTGLAEFAGANAYALGVGALVLFAGRLLHGYAFAFTDFHAFGRYFGTLLTLASLGYLALLNVALLFL